MPLPKEKERFTYRDYLTWPDEERWELIDGIAYDMSPAPNIKHQNIALNFSRILANALQGNPCVPFIAPTDVYLSEHDVVQPDIFVVCDKTKITEKNIQGAPDLVIEILSPHTSKKDRWDKKRLYEKYGVREYILIEPEARYVERYLLGTDGRFDTGEILDAQEILRLKSLPGVEIPLWEVFGVEKASVV